MPDLVVSGMNEGQNISELVEISGTVGAARAAVARGVPALATSQGFGSPPNFEVGVEYVVEWVEEARDELLAGTAPVEVANLNVPTCVEGEIRGLIEIETAELNADRPVNPSDCNSLVEDFEDDLDAFVNGYVTLSILDS